ncbi:MAG: UDP-N-acetylmuramoyl-tripeptide--D-alanyl-D-alanine ligase [Oligoflexales bacterium]
MITWSDYQLWAKDNLVSAPKTPTCPHPNQISTDSRAIEKGQWFLPLSGQTFNGNTFVDAAMARGAAGFFYESKHKNLISASSLQYGVEVNDSYLLLCQIAAGWRARFGHLQIVGITGSSGKTTAKELTRLVCEDAGPTLFTPASYNNEIGVPLTLLKINASHKYAIIEMGARHKGDLTHLGKIVQPTVACLLNVGDAHLGEFGSLENLIAAKLEIFIHVFEGATLVVNGDDDRLRVSPSRDNKVIKFGYGTNVDVKVADNAATLIKISYKGKTYQVHTEYHHEFLAKNIAAVFAICIAMGINPERVVASVAKFNGLKGRYKIHRLNDKIVIDDAYNANPQSMAAGLKSVSQQFESEKKVLILGDMLELGRDSERSHHKIGEVAGQIRHCHLITVGNDSKSIGAGARQSGLSPSRHFHFDNIEQFLKDFGNIKELGNVFYVKASHSVGLEKIVEHLLSAFSN